MTVASFMELYGLFIRRFMDSFMATLWTICAVEGPMAVCYAYRLGGFR
jgi:hypothetical protein